jgi:cytoskeleton protein RodZ
MTGEPSMSEADARFPESVGREDPLQGGTPLAGPSAGALLRQARESAGLHIAALAVALKVPVRKLEALEADRLDLLPDAVFVRALAASVCRTLKIDAGQVLGLLPQTGKPNLGQQHAPINTPFRSPGDGPGPTLLTQVSKPAVLAGLLFVLAALVLIFLPGVQPGEAPSVAKTVPTPVGEAPVAPQGAPSGEAMARGEMLGSEKPAETGRPAEALAPAVPASAVIVPLPPVEAAPASAVANPAAVSSPQPAATGIVVFKAKGESWVEVTDAKGVVVVRRTLAAGEEVGASGVLPLAAVVGRVDATQVQVRGKPFDLSAVSRDNVARFEVK